MNQKDFNIDELAAYLHLMPQQVERLASRGKLPGRRVSGAWQFPRTEIHHWFEDKIGVSDEGELVEVEGVLGRDQAGSLPESLQLVDLIPQEAVAVPLNARTRNSVIERMCELAAETGLLWDPPKMAEAVAERESLHSTALDNGVALLHPRRPLPNILGEAILAVGLTPQGIPFGGRGGLTDIFFLICSTSDIEHLQILARLSRVIGDAEFLSQLRECALPIEVTKLISEREHDIS